MAVTAKVVCGFMQDGASGSKAVDFYPDYQSDKNKEWADTTPSILVRMVLSEKASGLFQQGKHYTLTFEED